jgi:hypothetical protein
MAPKKSPNKIDGRTVSAKKARITREETRLAKIFESLNPDTRKVAEGLIRRMAYMRITLEDYEKDIDENGSVEMFTQTVNSPTYERMRPVAQLYNTMNKNYQSISKMLWDLLPKVDPLLNPEEKDGFDEFTNKRG